MSKPKLRQRIRRRLFGAKVELRIYEDGAIRCRVDHPSNEPGVEIAVTGLIVSALGKSFDAAGIGPVRVTGPLHWKDDPP